MEESKIKINGDVTQLVQAEHVSFTSEQEAVPIAPLTDLQWAEIRGRVLSLKKSNVDSQAVYKHLMMHFVCNLQRTYHHLVLMKLYQYLMIMFKNTCWETVKIDV